MFNPLSLVAPYDLEGDGTQFLDNLPAYNSSRGTIEQLDLAIQIQRSGNYYWQGISFPYGDATLVSGGTTVSGSIQVPPGSYITSIQIYNDFTLNPAGFKLTLYDKGSKQNFYYGDYMLDRLAGSDMQLQVGVGDSNPPSDPGMNGDNPFGPGYKMSPAIITSPGVIGWEVVSQGDVSVSAQLQVLLCLAIPINHVTIGQRIVNRGSS